ncbi:MAG: hypothetical protein A2Z93_09230 [Curvibacter sp. GWA2_64_110]|nr:MAG: hypothetical protein A2Z93_09230 [Curvibacter sp. GWA2_64_110]HCY15968.1 hypothetical protein [Curvibacter sp.]
MTGKSLVQKSLSFNRIFTFMALFEPMISQKPAWLSYFEMGLEIPRRKACRFDSGPGHHIAPPLF